MRLELLNTHIVPYVITHADVVITGDVSSLTSNFKIVFIATKRLEGDVLFDLVEDQPLDQVVVNNQPFDLYVKLRRCVDEFELIEQVNTILQSFNGLFVGTLKGLDLRIKSVEFREINNNNE